MSLILGGSMKIVSVVDGKPGPSKGFRNRFFDIISTLFFFVAPNLSLEF